MKSFCVYMIALTAFFGVFSTAFFGQNAYAVTAPEFQQLENIPGYEGNKTFPEYVGALYNLGLWIVGISAMFMLSVGGFMYLTSAGNTSSASTAKGVIKDALIGLVLGLSAWLIVNTINPDLTSVSVSGLATGTSIPPGSVPPPLGSLRDLAGAISSGKLASSGDCKDSSGHAVSPASNINEVKSGQSMTACYHGCRSTSSTACTGKVNPSATMLSAINSVNGYTITSISGGSHAADDSAHYRGNAIDVAPGSSNRADWVSLRDEFIIHGASPNNPDRTGTFCEDVNGLFKMDCVGADHIHVRFQ